MKRASGEIILLSHFLAWPDHWEYQPGRNKILHVSGVTCLKLIYMYVGPVGRLFISARCIFF